MSERSNHERETWAKAIHAPLRLPPDPVFRPYVGGDLLRRFRGHPLRGDDHWPEEWLASMTSAGNPAPDGRVQGLSRVEGPDGRSILLGELVTEFPEAMVGRAFAQRYGATTGVLVKLISLSAPGPLHAHPDRAFAMRHLGLPHGKAEAWVLLETPGRDPEPADAGVALCEGVTREAFRRAIELRSSERLRDMLHRTTIGPGEAWFLAPGVPHMLGPGVLFIEVQEPSDLSVIPEHWAIGADEAGATMGLGWATALDSIDLEPRDRSSALARAREHEAVIWARGDTRITRVLAAASQEYFDIHRYEVSEEVEVSDERFAVLVVVEGDGWLVSESGRQRVTRGDALALPAAAPLRILAGTGRLVAYRCMGPAVG